MPSIKKTYFATLGLFMLLFSFASQTNAQSLTITNVSLPSGTPFAFSITSTVANMNIGVGGAGQLLLNTQEKGVVGAWCVDLFHGINVGNVNYTYTTGFLTTNSSGATQAASATLSTAQIHDVLALVSYGNRELAYTSFPTPTAKAFFSGTIQAAIWSVVYGAAIVASGSDVGSFTAAAFNAQVSTYVANAQGWSTGTAVAIHNWATVGDVNSLIQSQGLVTTVPAPGPLALLAVGLIGLMARQRKNA
jgi:hypothetical protein